MRFVISLMIWMILMYIRSNMQMIIRFISKSFIRADIVSIRHWIRLCMIIYSLYLIMC